MLLGLLLCFVAVVRQVFAAGTHGSCQVTSGNDSVEIDICRESSEGIRFSKAYMYFHTDGLDQRFSFCACQVSTDRDSDVFTVQRTFTPETNDPVEFLVFTTNVSLILNASVYYWRGPIFKDLPWKILAGLKNLSRDISADSRKKYCILVDVHDRANISLQCQTFPAGIVEEDGAISVPVFVSCLTAVAVVFLTCGLGFGFLCKNKPKVRRLKGETPVHDYRDSGIASDGHLGCTSQDMDSGSEYTTVDSRKTLHVNTEHLDARDLSSRQTVIMVDNSLYA